MDYYYEYGIEAANKAEAAKLGLANSGLDRSELRKFSIADGWPIMQGSDDVSYSNLTFVDYEPFCNELATDVYQRLCNLDIGKPNASESNC